MKNGKSIDGGADMHIPGTPQHPSEGAQQAYYRSQNPEGE